MNIQNRLENAERYLVDRHGTNIRPHRVFDTQKCQTMIVTADHALAVAMAEEFNDQWRRSQRWPRFVEAVKRLFGRQRATEPANPLSVREQRLSNLDAIIERAQRRRLEQP